jgi:Lrp/AsnC family transcriptional regulator for asnA, asnC and gidA
MDELDILILQSLQKDGRTPFTQIAEKAGVSETTIRTRYRTLLEEGAIRTAGIANPRALGFEVQAIIGVAVELGLVDQAARTIAAFPEVDYLVMTLGSFDLIVEVYCRDVRHLTELVTERIHPMPGVRATEMLMVAKSYKLSHSWSPVRQPAAVLSAT